MTFIRRLLALHALWVVISLPSLPALFTWPAEFWSGARSNVALRYLWVFPASVEWILYVTLVVALILAIIGIAPRAASVSAALLLYHFTPLEDVWIGSPGPYMRGLTADVLGMCLAGCAPAKATWPILLVRLSVAFPYFFSTIAKLYTTGPEWFAGSNVRDMALIFQAVGSTSFADLVIRSPLLAWTIGVGWFAVSVGMLAASFSRRVAALVVPAAAVAHLAAIPLFGVIWIAAPLLLVFLPLPQPSETENSSAQRQSA
jgi:hypothetical protein